jgi:hypothetical protein
VAKSLNLIKRLLEFNVDFLDADKMNTTNDLLVERKKLDCTLDDSCINAVKSGVVCNAESGIFFGNGGIEKKGYFIMSSAIGRHSEFNQRKSTWF